MHPSNPPRRDSGRTRFKPAPVSALAVIAAAVLFGHGSATAQILTVTYADLADPISGTDRWAATYRLEGTALEAGQGFTVYLPHADIRNITLTEAPSSSEWDVLLLQPDLGIPDDGFLDGLAVSAAPRSEGPFRISFDWLASSSTPWEQTQTFEFYETTGGFQVTGTGSVTPVPEPAWWGLGVGLGLFGFGIYSRTQRSRA